MAARGWTLPKPLPSPPSVQRSFTATVPFSSFGRRVRVDWREGEEAKIHLDPVVVGAQLYTAARSGRAPAKCPIRRYWFGKGGLRGRQRGNELPKCSGR